MSPSATAPNQTVTTIPQGYTPLHVLGTGPYKAELVAPHSVKPRYLVRIANEDWPEVTNVTIEFHGGYITGNFTVDAIYSLVSQDKPKGPDPMRIGKADPNSRLFRLIKAVTKEDAENRALLQQKIQYLIHRIPVEIYADFTTKDEPQLSDFGSPAFQGVVDKVQLDITRNLVTIQGRDYSAIFLDTYTHAQFRAKTTSGIVREIAEGYEFNTDNVVDVETPAGTVYDYEQIHDENIPSSGQNNWDILHKMADFDLFKVFTLGRSIYYVPIDAYHDVIEFRLDTNIDELELTKNFSSSTSRISVEIATSQLKEKANTMAVGGLSSAAAGGGSKGDTVSYRFVEPNLTPEQAGYLAETLALFYAQYEFVGVIHTTGAPQQSILNKVHLHGTGLDFDSELNREYQITRLKWDLGWETGWRSEIAILSLPPGDRLSIHRKKFPKTLTQGRSRR